MRGQRQRTLHALISGQHAAQTFRSHKGRNCAGIARIARGDDVRSGISQIEAISGHVAETAWTTIWTISRTRRARVVTSTSRLTERLGPLPTPYGGRQAAAE